MADKKVDSAYMTITGDHIRCMNTQGAIALNRNKANGSINNDPISKRHI